MSSGISSVEIVRIASSVALLTGSCFSIAACSGVDINSIGRQQVQAAHNCTSSSCKDRLSGYVVYQPMVVVPVSLERVCEESGSDCSRGAQQLKCVFGEPFVMPDYSRAYIVDVKNGFGQAGVELAFADGWRLESVTDNSDNTAMLESILNLLGQSAMQPTLHTGDAQNNADCKPGLYRLQEIDGVPVLKLIGLED